MSLSPLEKTQINSVHYLLVCDAQVLAKSPGDVLFGRLEIEDALNTAVGQGIVTTQSLTVAIDQSVLVNRSDDFEVRLVAFSKKVAKSLLDHYNTSENALNWLTLRSLIVEEFSEQFYLLSRAIQLYHWLEDHRYCGVCAGKTRSHTTEPALMCSRCKRFWYPRIQPCVIVLIHKNNDEVLLAKHGKYISDMYSCIAGFVESGETLEQAARREIKEEVGVDVDELQYFSSQPWPFPNQLMIGFFARYNGGEIIIDGDEIIDAKWFSLKQLPVTPPKTSIAGQMIEFLVQRQR
ncbi:hypothetical protein MAH1_32270 [Sessilibacter sp. MAH1]